MKRSTSYYLSGVIFSVLLITNSCREESTYYIKSVTFPAGATPQQKAEMAARVAPTPQQLAWQQLELTAFIHFGINTFTGREWGDGTESPALFNPEAFDARQWVRALQEGGIKMLILTAKHHDGFCLWPTSATGHSVAASPWRGGRGDVVKEVKEACDSMGMKFGVYLSPWDRNAPSYGDSPGYNELFRQQLTELLSNYGRIDEVWFDGACGEGPNGKRQEYDWASYYEVISRLQPGAVTAIKGEDVRWVGTETGYGRPTEWSVTAFAPGGRPEMAVINRQLGLNEMSEDLGSRELLAKAGSAFWYPAEVDVSIRPGWFWHKEENNQVKSLEKLADIYFNSVGMNAVLLLNVPPDTRGLIHDSDVLRLKEFGRWIGNTFSDNLLTGAKARKRKHSTAIDGNPDTGWETGRMPENAEFSLKQPARFDIIELKEDIRKGQKVEAFRVEAAVQGEWQEIASGTTIGYRRLLKINPVETDKIRIILSESRGKACIAEAGLYQSAGFSR